jgi:hypothetical protein
MIKKSILLMMFLSSPVYGMVYTWTDASGVPHFTNRDYEIPARYRTKAKALYPEQSDASSPQQNAQSQPAKPVQEASPAEQPKPQPPSIVSEPPNNPPVRPPRRSKRIRSPEDE